MKTGHPLREASMPSLSPQVATLVAFVRQRSVPMSERQRSEGLSALRSRAHGGRRQRVVRRTQLALATAVGCALLVGAVRRERRQASPSFRVDGAVVGAGGYIQADPSAHPVVHFGDGSEVLLDGNARFHVLATSEHGARVMLDEGRAHVHVVHTRETSWLVEAGPFAVAVTGTAFAIAWSEAEQLLDLRLESGSVTVRGPDADPALSLHAGQWLTVRAKEVLLRNLAEIDSAQKPTAASANAADETAARDPFSEASAEANSDHDVTRANALTRRRTRARFDSGARKASAASLPPKGANHHWAAAVAKGRFEAVVDDALGMGLDAAFSDSTSDDLAALGDAARYSRHHDIARGALLALRRRFSSSDHARAAAFLLGRLSEADDDDRAALSWFESYLAEAPDGRFAPEALGRKINLVQRHDGKDAAKPLAADYLRRFPDGTYAEAARALMRTP